MTLSLEWMVDLVRSTTQYFTILKFEIKSENRQNLQSAELNLKFEFHIFTGRAPIRKREASRSQLHEVEHKSFDTVQMFTKY